MRGLFIPVHDYPQIISDDTQAAKSFVFGSDSTTISTFDGLSNYYHYTYEVSHKHPVNVCATYFKRLYTQNYFPLNLVRGDILVYSSSDSMPHIIDSSVLPYFIDQVMAFMASYDHAFTKH